MIYLFIYTVEWVLKLPFSRNRFYFFWFESFINTALFLHEGEINGWEAQASVKTFREKFRIGSQQRCKNKLFMPWTKTLFWRWRSTDNDNRLKRDFNINQICKFWIRDRLNKNSRYQYKQAYSRIEYRLEYSSSKYLTVKWPFTLRRVTV